jgi:hypothetical protein
MTKLKWTNNITDQGGASRGLPRKARIGYQAQTQNGQAILRRLRRGWRLSHAGSLYYGPRMTAEDAQAWAEKVMATQ